jgi:hypothetical protein
MLDLQDGVVIPAKWKVNPVIHFLVVQVTIALLQTITTFTVAHMLLNFSGWLTKKVVLKINTPPAQHLAKLRRCNTFFQPIAKTASTE